MPLIAWPFDSICDVITKVVIYFVKTFVDVLIASFIYVIHAVCVDDRLNAGEIDVYR